MTSVKSSIECARAGVCMLDQNLVARPGPSTVIYPAIRALGTHAMVTSLYGALRKRACYTPSAATLSSLFVSPSRTQKSSLGRQTLGVHPTTLRCGLLKYASKTANRTLTTFREIRSSLTDPATAPGITSLGY